MTPLVSVVVPIYNVVPYLRACLDSVVAQARQCRLDVVLVDDGSTDESASIAEAYVERHPFMRLIRQKNGGLGHARNVGAGHALGEYLVFLDSDDVLPDGTYAAMVEALEEPGVDFVTGNVVRLRGTTPGPSGAHQKSHAASRACAHISQNVELLWDTTAWNKMFRRTFWDSQGFMFPAGVLYEDMELMTRAHLLARQVAVLARVSYLWRIRSEWPPSITQCRTDLQNLDDRFKAIFALFETVQRHGTPEVRAAYEHKVLSLDVPIYVRHYGRNDTEQYRSRLQAYVKRVLQQCTTDAVSRVATVDRLKYWLFANDRADEVSGINRSQDSHFDMCPLTVAKGRVLRTYPTLQADSQEIPAELTDVTNELSPHTCVYDIRREGRDLQIDAHAFVPGISPETSRAMVRRFYLRNAESGRCIDLDARRWSTRVPTAMLQLLHFDGTWSRVTLRLPVDDLVEKLTDDGQAASWEVWVDCRLEGLVWKDRVRRRDGEYMDREHYVDRRDHRVRAFLSREDRLEVRVEPIATLARCDAADLDVDGFRISLTGTADTSAPTLVLHGDHGAVHEWQLQSTGLDGSWKVQGHQLSERMAESRLSRSALTLRVGTTEHRVIAPPGFLHEWTAPDGQIVNVAGDADGYLVAFRRAGCQIADLSLSAHGVLQVQIEAPRREDTPGAVLEMVNKGNGRRLPLRSATAGDPLRFEIDLAHVERWSVETPVSLGDWRIVAHSDTPAGVEYEPQVAARVRDTLPARCRAKGICFGLRVDDTGKTVLRVTADWPEHADLHATRRSLETGLYPFMRSQPITQSVVFDSWGATRFNDGPRRIYDELTRRVPHAQVTWVVRDPSIWIPDGVNRALRGTRDYFEALGRARYVVTNAPMPEHFQKRDGCTYVRLGRGIPVKRIGADVTGVASLAASAIRRQTGDARQWDVLVTGHPHASDVYRRAFGYDGTVLDAGQPRLDRLVDADASSRRERVRTLLGVETSERLVLYAPTWRDNLFARPNKYVMSQGLEISTLLDQLADGWRLVLKNHPFVGERTGRPLDRRAIDASRYPEMTDLYLAADVLVTDYSSAIFDYAVTGKPILVFAPDLDEYRERIRGVYWDMEADLPGPVLRSTGAVIEQLRDLSALEGRWQSRYDAFQSRFCGLEDGHASERVVETVFADWLD